MHDGTSLEVLVVVDCSACLPHAKVEAEVRAPAAPCIAFVSLLQLNDLILPACGVYGVRDDMLHDLVFISTSGKRRSFLSACIPRIATLHVQEIFVD